MGAGEIYRPAEDSAAIIVNVTQYYRTEIPHRHFQEARLYSQQVLFNIQSILMYLRVHATVITHSDLIWG